MNKIIFILLFNIIAITSTWAFEVDVITVDGSINPVSSNFIINSVNRAEKSADLLIILLDTPGGLMSSTRDIVQKMLVAEVPVAVYVYPSGARAGSAGVFITLAANIAVMAPGTNIGAAHPVNMGGQMDTTMSKKVTNDAVAFVRSIAEQRGRDQDWAEAAVRESASITSTDAIEKGIIDIVAKNIEDLLAQIDGMNIKLQDEEVILETADYTISHYEMSWREQLLDKISDPNIAYILLMIGFYGLLFELYNPGAILPGIIGGICLILAFFAMQTLPVNWAGVLLIVLAIILFLLEIKVTSYGMLTIGGVVSLLLGSIMLFKGDPDLPSLAVRVSWSVLIPVVATTVLFFLVVLTFGIKAQKRRPDYGKEALVGKEALAVEKVSPKRGMVRVEGELWIAYSDEEYEAGETLKVLEVKGMQLKVGKS